MTYVLKPDGRVNRQAAIKELSKRRDYLRERSQREPEHRAYFAWRRELQALEWAIAVCREQVSGGGQRS